MRRYAFLLTLLLAPLVPWTQDRIEARFGDEALRHDVMYVWSGERIKRLSPGLEGLMADVYWLRTVQYFGYQRVYDEQKSYDLLLPLIRITTTLDARLEIAYRYGATFLSEPWPIGAGKPQEGAKVLSDGISRNPGNWRLYQELGLLYFVHLGDPVRAGEILEQGSRVPGAPSWMKSLAAAAMIKGGERSTARTLWLSIYQESEPGPMRDNAALHLEIIKALDAVGVLEGRIAAFRAASARLPASLMELQRSEGGRLVLVDPTGVPFDYDPTTGTCRIAKRSALWRANY